MGNQKEKRKYSVPALDHAFSILKLLSRKWFQESTVTEIANALSLSPATCYRILQVLEEHGIVRYLEDNKRYTLGPYLVVLGERAKEHLNYISLIMPYLQEITKETQMTSVLVNKVGEDKLAIIAKNESSDYGLTASVGRHFNFMAGSYGMPFLAYLTKEERTRYLKEVRNMQEEERKLLEQSIENIKTNGFYVSNGDWKKGICGVSAPIFTGPNKVEMVIALIGVADQYNYTDLYEKGIQMKKVADEISSIIMIR